MGIGTVEPVHKLSIKQANSGDYQLHLMQSNSNDGYLLNGDAADGGLSFSRRSGSTITETVRFTAAGNVGIGVTEPGVKFNVTGLQGLPVTSGTVQTYGILRTASNNFVMDVGNLSNGSTWIQIGGQD